MTQLCCPQCRLRFSPAASAYVTSCPECGETPQPTRAASSLGFRLVDPEDLPLDPLGLGYEFPEAIAVAIPVPGPDARP